MKWLIICCGVIFLSGCSAGKSQFVRIPVVAKSNDNLTPIKPNLSIANLKSDSAPNDVIKAYASSLDTCIGYSKQLEVTLAARS